jgi:hypothetical protein
VPTVSPAPTVSPRHELKHSFPLPKASPDDFEPSGGDVIMVRGQSALKQPGNKRFRAIVAANMTAYSNTTFRAETAWVINTIIDQVRAYSTSGGGGQMDYVRR